MQRSVAALMGLRGKENVKKKKKNKEKDKEKKEM